MPVPIYSPGKSGVIVVCPCEPHPLDYESHASHCATRAHTCNIMYLMYITAMPQTGLRFIYSYNFAPKAELRYTSYTETKQKQQQNTIQLERFSVLAVGGF